MQGGIEWQPIQPDARHTWLTKGLRDEFDTFMPMGTKEVKGGKRHVCWCDFQNI